MNNFNKATDNVDNTNSGFINKSKLMEYVTEEDIFQLVFGFKPKEFEYTTSPFRDDSDAGCWFEIDPSTNKLRFCDFANSQRIRGVKMSNIDCFDAVKIYFGLPNFYKTLEFIKQKLIDGKDVKHNIDHKTFKKPTKKKTPKNQVRILLNTREFTIIDKKFWFDRYGITKQNLIDDKVFPIKKFKLFNTKKGDLLFNCKDAAYAYTEFKSGNKKIYMPYRKSGKKFSTNCVADDVGGMNSPITSGRLLIITKSYKDYRVLRNLGLNVRWLQNEGMFPRSDEFWNLIKNFDKVVVFFDNDEAGIKASEELVNLINFTEINKASSVHLPITLLKEGITDPSDLVHKRNINELINFLKLNRLLL